MRVLILGSLRSWMGLHLSHIESAFRKRGHVVAVRDYHAMSSFWGLPLPEKTAAELRQRSLEKIVRNFHPDLIYCPASWKYDFPRLKSYYKGITAIHDLDGPRRLTPEILSAFGQVDLPLSASQYMIRMLAEKGVRVRYLAAAADPDYYSPGPLSGLETERFAAKISCIGRATPHRVECCAALAHLDLALYGRRWRTQKDSIRTGLDHFSRMGRDVEGRELVSIYRASTAVLNILQEPLNEFHTILSLQCFAIPMTGGCLIAEYTEEAESAFEPGREILLFRTPDELRLHAEHCVSDPSFAAAVGKAARERCFRCHTHDLRIAELEKMMA